MPVEEAATMLSSLRDDLIARTEARAAARATATASACLEAQEELTEELEERLRKHWPRKGRTEVQCGSFNIKVHSARSDTNSVVCSAKSFPPLFSAMSYACFILSILPLSSFLLPALRQQTKVGSRQPRDGELHAHRQKARRCS